MNSLSRDPIINVIDNGIRKAIDVAVKNECFAATVILIFAGIDAMANINRPADRDSSTAQDFKNWVKKYFHVNGQTQISPEEWWAARNAIIHTWGTYSAHHRQDGIRILLWMVGSVPHVRYSTKEHLLNFVLVDIIAMRDAFFKGMEQFLIDGFSDPTRKHLMEQRLNKMVMDLPTP